MLRNSDLHVRKRKSAGQYECRKSCAEITRQWYPRQIARIISAPRGGQMSLRAISAEAGLSHFMSLGPNRVLKPGGHFLFNVWDRIENNEFSDDVTNALARIFPNDPPRFMARTPHGYHDTALIRSELEEAGFSRVVIETRAEQSRASSPRIPAVAYCQGTVLRNEIETRASGKLEFATDYVASAISDKHGHGEVAAKIQSHVIVAVV